RHLSEERAAMDHSVGPQPEQLLAEARAGRRDSLGALLERHRVYLRVLAGAKIAPRLRAQANPSDLVQETFLLASRHFDQFRGTGAAEWLHWLRCILHRCLSRFIRRHVRAGKRNVYRQVPLPARGPTQLPLADPGSSPSAGARRRELTDLVAERLA